MARDLFHEQVKDALKKEGWIISHDPYILKTTSINYDVDLGAEKLIAANRENVKIAVEVKSFLRQSKTYEMHTALGQFNTYLFGLKEQEPDRELFLAVPIIVYNDFFQKPFIEKLLKHYQVKLIVFDPILKSINQWIK